VAGDEAVRRAAASAGLKVLGAARQERPSFFAEARTRVRCEHLLLLSA
jgi:hypothetical protein